MEKKRTADFFDRTGKMAIGSRLRILTDTITREAALIYDMYGVDLQPKWFPVFFALSHSSGGRTIMSIAEEIGHSHPSVSNIVKEMMARKLVRRVEEPSDKRCTVIALTARGERTAALLTDQCADVEAAIEKISRQCRNDLWRAIGEWEELLSERSLFERVKEEKRIRERRSTRIVPYEHRYQPVFRALNEEWITARWQMEEADYKALDHPKEYILDKGGHIFVALYEDEPVGVCALCRTDDPAYDYELAKYAVSPRAQGKGIGMLLGRAAIDKARELGAKKLFLESNTQLKPALHIYRKLGFRELAEYHPAYERGDIQMELILDQPATSCECGGHRETAAHETDDRRRQPER